MNRVLGDYFETLLYKIFVSIDEHTSVSEVRFTLQAYYTYWEILKHLCEYVLLVQGWNDTLPSQIDTYLNNC